MITRRPTRSAPSPWWGLLATAAALPGAASCSDSDPATHPRPIDASSAEGSGGVAGAAGGAAGVAGASSGGADGGTPKPCIVGTWSSSVTGTNCGSFTTETQVSEADGGFEVTRTFDNVTQWDADAGQMGTCGNVLRTASNVAFDGTSLRYSFVVGDLGPCATVVNTETLTPGPGCTTASLSSASDGCGTCTAYGCSDCGSNTCPGPSLPVDKL